MTTLRKLVWPEDRAALLALDTAFSTDRVYQLVGGAAAWQLDTVAVSPPRSKSYDLTHEVDDWPAFEHVAVAELAGRVVGVAALKPVRWNRRAELWHLYVDRAARGRGVGRLLLEQARQVARQWDVRALWLETQTINYPAIQFYQHMGFTWCGFDTSLYDPREVPSDDVALFFACALDQP